MSRYRFPGWRPALLTLALGMGVVTGASAQTKAALVRDVDRATAQPVNGACSGFSAAFNITKCLLYTVPAGKRLVVESISFQSYTDSAQSVVRLLFGKDSPQYANIAFGAGVYSGSPGTPAIASGTKYYSGFQPVRFYMEEGDGLAAEVDYTGGSNYQQSFSFSGHLVDK
jgi:hypothetical protein